MARVTKKSEALLPAVVASKPPHLSFVNIGKEPTPDFRHAMLTDVSGKAETFENIDFSYAVFTRAYFHKAKFTNCKFVGARFTDCNFRNADIVNCDFRYADFTGTRIDTKEIVKNLPDEPNIRKELLQILRKNAISMGDVRSGRIFVLKEIAATKEHLRRAWRQDEKYYRQKYGGFWRRSKVGLDRILLAMDSFLWGHGEKLWKMLISIGLLLVVCAGISTLTMSANEMNLTVVSVFSNFSDALGYYFNLFIDVPSDVTIPRTVLLERIVVISRYVAFGVLIAGLFRLLSHR